MRNAVSTEPPHLAELLDNATSAENPSVAESAASTEPAGRDVEQHAARERRRRSVPQSAMGGAGTLEDVMRELLRPVMQGWIDEKLLPIIEREVRGELARAFREGAGALDRR